MEDKNFFDRLASALENIRKEHDLQDKHDTLLFWFLLYKHDLDPGDLRERIVHDKHAEGVDAVVLDARQNLFYFAQAKSVANFANTKKNLPEADVKATLAGVEFLLRGDYKGKITPELENFVDEYHDYERSGDYQTKVVFVAEQQPPVSTKFIDDFIANHKVTIELISFAALKEFYEKEYLIFRSPPPSKISFEVTGNPHQKDAPFPSAVFTIKAKELAKTYNEHRERLFQQNVRDPMGIKGAINKLIYKTASDVRSGESFWYFNNGINLVCRRMHLATSGKVITLEEPQIINGAQTTHAIHQAYLDGTLAENVELLVKAAQVVDRPFVDQITRYSNAQNAIRLRDLTSNDETQDRLYRSLLDSYNVFYQRKRGEFDMQFPTIDSKIQRFGRKYQEHILDNEKTGLAYLATFLNRPVEAKKEKWKVFYKDGGYYQDIFDDRLDGLSERLLFVWKLSNFIDTRKRLYRRRYNAEKDKRSPDKAVVNDFFITQADFFLMNLVFGQLSTARDLQSVAGAKEAIGLIDSQASELDKAYKTAVDTLRKQYLKDKERAGSYLNSFFKSEKQFVLVREAAGLD
jgi:hypothetical protein